ncbi:MAG: hypothetical protein D3910_20515, partial [Candidatus Electrothrix sp. ATG2]|nr:hypothetical protein [Candidatus Electrothrix sp. ATG2]
MLSYRGILMVRLLKNIMQVPPARWLFHLPLSTRRILLLSAASGASLLLTLTAFCTVLSWERARLEFDFERMARNQTSRLEETFHEYQAAVQFIGNFLENSNNASRKAFQGFAEKVLQTYPGMQAVSWNPIIPDNQRSAYEEAARQDGFTDFQFLEKNPQGQ